MSKPAIFSAVVFPRFALTYATPITIDAAISGAYSVVLTGATALFQNATNKQVGMRFDVLFTQDGVGGREVTWDTDYDFGSEGTPVLASLTAGRQALVSFEVLSLTHVICTTRYDFRAS